MATADDFCDVCGEDVGTTSHYHCANCGEVCSLMGHLERGGGFSCEAKKPAVGDALAAAGWVTGDAAYFLGVPPEERAEFEAAVKARADELRAAGACNAEYPVATFYEPPTYGWTPEEYEARQALKKWSGAVSIDSLEPFPLPDVPTAPSSAAMSPEMFARVMGEIYTGSGPFSDDTHALADDLMRRVLRDLGYGAGVDIFQRING